MTAGIASASKPGINNTDGGDWLKKDRDSGAGYKPTPPELPYLWEPRFLTILQRK